MHHWLYFLYILLSFFLVFYTACYLYKYTSIKEQPLALLQHTCSHAVNTHFQGICIRLIQIHALISLANL